MRKSPKRHSVKAHTRNRRPVHSYMRGHGASRTLTRKRRLEGSSRKSMEDYKITFFYSKGRKEVIPVAGRDADDALNVALKTRKQKHLKPIKITVVDGLGAMLGKVVGAAAGGVHSAVESFRAQYAKGATERAELKQLREESAAKKEAWLEDKSKEMLRRAKGGERIAQIWCDKHGIGWEEV